MNFVDLYAGNKTNADNISGSEYLIIRGNTASHIRKMICDDTDTEAEIEKKNKKMEGQITQKLKAGEPLTPKEKAFLKRYNNILYRYAVIAETKRKCVENQLKNCKSKEDVQKVQESAMSEINMKSPVAEMMSSAANYAINEFKKSDGYKKLPATNKEAEASKTDIKNKHKLITGKRNQENKNSDTDETSESQTEDVTYNISFGCYQQAFVAGGETPTLNIHS